jgi:hypothetical protein
VIWAIYLRDWQTAKRKGDPLLAIVVAESKADAERRAEDAGINWGWGWSALFAVPHRGPRECGVPALETP